MITGKIDFSEFTKFVDKIEKLAKEDMQRFTEQTVKELAARLLAKIVARTLPGKYENKLVEFIAYKGTENEKEVRFMAKSNKVGGTLRRGWTGGKDIDPVLYIMNDLEVVKKGNVYKLILSNPVNYALT